MSAAHISSPNYACLPLSACGFYIILYCNIVYYYIFIYNINLLSDARMKLRMYLSSSGLYIHTLDMETHLRIHERWRYVNANCEMTPSLSSRVHKNLFVWLHLCVLPSHLCASPPPSNWPEQMRNSSHVYESQQTIWILAKNRFHSRGLFAMLLYLESICYLIECSSFESKSIIWNVSFFVLPPPSVQAEKRAHHNALERKRRDHIKDSFTSLRDSVPSLQGEKVVCMSAAFVILLWMAFSIRHRQ